ncbi:MAG: FapA family protein [Planctomycetota bacterium]|nr:FapA family protein [Planctomycetota bacterium]
MAKTQEQDDFGISVRLEGNAFEARVIITERCDPANLSVQMLAALLRQHDVEVGKAVEERLAKIVEAYRADRKPRQHIVAKASPAIHGEDGIFAWATGFDPTSEHSADRAKEASHDNVDFYSQSSHITVAAGTRIAALRPPTDGTDGRDVVGGVLKARPGKPVDIKIDASLRVDEKGCVIAEIDGILQFHRGSVKVSPVLEVAEFVDFSTGNIDFDGSVLIRQGVRDRFVVKATRDVIIHGLVEAATIVCGGNFECRRGIAAKDRGQILVEGDADVGFLNNVRGQIKGQLTIRREIINCDLVIGQNLRCERGAIIGGTTAITGSLCAMTLGAKAETETVLVLGSAPLLTARFNQLKKDCPVWQEQLERFRYEQKQLSAGRGAVGEQQQERLTALNSEISDLQRKLQDAQEERTRIEQEMATQGKVEIQIEKIIYPKVRFEAGAANFTFTEALKGPATIGWNERKQLVFRQGDGRIRPLSDVAKKRPLAA